MKQLLTIFFILPIISFAQSNHISIKIEVKPTDPKMGYTFNLYKSKDEIKIEYKKIDSIGKVSLTNKDKKIIAGLIAKTEIDSATKDSIDYYQRKLDTIKVANTFYSTDSMSVYKTTHKSYFKLLEDVINSQDSALVKPQGGLEIIGNTYCFFTINEGKVKEERKFYIECLEPKIFPILTKLVNDTNAIVQAYKAVRGRKK